MVSVQTDRDKIDEIKSRLDIVDVIGRDITLHFRGNSEYVGTVGSAGGSGESLKVNRDLQVWKDFKNNRGGDVLDWVGYNNGFTEPRGADFPEVLRIAADLAGIELTDITEEEQEAAKEKADIHNLYTEAAEIYHRNLKERPELYGLIEEKWGITPETVDRLKIGYATESRNLKELNRVILQKSGLVHVNNGLLGGEVFIGRIVFPYWKNGKVVYLIGREMEETPKAEREKGMKYKKLLVHKEGQEYISPSVQNSYFYGEDSLRGAEFYIITEGVADCIAMLQAGFPCISPVTVQFRDVDHPRLINLTKGLKRVYICNDNEASKAGLKGALNTAEALESTGIETRIVELPKPEGIDKIDIADYMKEHSSEDFKGLMDSSIRLWTYKLNQRVIPASSTSLEKLAAYTDFISGDLQGMKQVEWDVFVKNDVREYFGLKGADVKNAILGVAKRRNKTEVAVDVLKEGPEDSDIDLDEVDISDEEKEAARLEAIDILQNGDPIKYILDTVKRSHTGDEDTQEGICISIAGQSCLNTAGVQISVNGESGSGKSHGLKMHLHLVPAKYKKETSLSPKAAYYMELEPGTIIFSDDTTPNPDMEEVIKRATTNYQEYTLHTTVREGKSLNFKIPPRINWYLTSVDSEVSEQLLNRQLTFNTLNTSEQKNAIFEMQKQEAKNGELGILVINKEVLVCRRIYDLIKSRFFKVKIPFANDIDLLDKSNSRIFPLFLDMIKGYTIFFHAQRKIDDQGYLLATKEDFDRAKKLFESQAKGIVSKLNDKERTILSYIAKNPGCTIPEIAIGTQLSDSTVRSALKGRKDRPSKGFLLEKVKGLKVSDETHTKEAKDGQTFADRAEHFTFEKGYNVWESLNGGFVTLKSDNR